MLVWPCAGSVSACVAGQRQDGFQGGEDLSLELLSELGCLTGLHRPIFPSHYGFAETLNYFKLSFSS